MDFEKLQDIIDFAIGKEQEAMDFYSGLSLRVQSPEVAKELRNMASMEERHRDWLRDNSVALASSAPPVQVANLHISDYTVEPEPTDNMSWQDIVNMAMHRETAAMNLYNSLVQLVSDPTTKQMFENLAAEEARHKLYFESIWDDRVLTEN